MRDLDRARAWLTIEVAGVRDSYERGTKRPQARLGRPGLYVYRGGLPLRLRILVDVEAGEVVDVLSLDGGRSTSRASRYNRHAHAD